MLETIGHADGRVTEIRLDRPPVNALNPELVAALGEALETLPAGSRAAVLSGSPGMFSAGLDVPALLQLDEPAMRAFWDSFFALLKRIAGAPVPLIAAITGHSPAGGAVLATFCDYRIMAEGDYRIGLNEVQVGLPVPDVVFAGMARLVGVRRAEQFCARGSMLSPVEALEAGFVDRLADSEAVIGDAIAEAAMLAELPPVALRETRRIARADLLAEFERLPTAETLTELWFSEETQQRMQALVDRLKKK